MDLEPAPAIGSTGLWFPQGGELCGWQDAWPCWSRWGCVHQSFGFASGELSVASELTPEQAAFRYGRPLDRARLAEWIVEYGQKWRLAGQLEAYRDCNAYLDKPAAGVPETALPQAAGCSKNQGAPGATSRPGSGDLVETRP